jgi:hypothetical protein
MKKMAEIINAKVSVLKRGYHRLTLRYGNTYSDGSFHKGVDFTGNPTVKDGYDDIVAFADGEVITSGYLSDTGYWVRIRHANGIITRYMHMKKGSLKVKVGDKVKKGQTIGLMGSTGNSTARHLHFDLSYPGKTQNGYYVASQNVTYVDPLPYILGTKTLDTAEYSTGKYRVVKAVNVRKGASSSSQRIMYKDFTANAKEQIKKLGGKPEDNVFPKGMILTISEVNVTFGKCPSGWVSLNLCERID